MGTRSVCFVTSSFNLILLDPFRFDYGPHVIAISLLIEVEIANEEAKVGLVARLTCLVFLTVINGKCMKKFVNLRKIVILFIYLLLIKKKSGGTKDENVIATWENGELRIVKATDIQGKKLWWVILEGKKTVVGSGGIDKLLDMCKISVELPSTTIV